jgi:hypothetical protein
MHLPDPFLCVFSSHKDSYYVTFVWFHLKDFIRTNAYVDNNFSYRTDWTTGRTRFDPRQRRKDFPSILCVQTGSGAHPASCTMGTEGPFPGDKARPGRDADHSPPSSFEVVNDQKLHLLSPKPLHDVVVLLSFLQVFLVWFDIFAYRLYMISSHILAWSPPRIRKLN